MAQTFSVSENGIHLVWEVNAENDVHLLHVSPLPLQEGLVGDEKSRKMYRMAEVHVSGENLDDHHGSRHTGSMPAGRLKYREHKDYRNEFGRKLEITAEADGVVATSHMQFFDGIPVLEAWTEVLNEGGEAIGLEYVSSFALSGLAKEGLQTWDKKCALYVPHSTWAGECQWRRSTLPELGLTRVLAPQHRSIKRVSLSSIGTWTCHEFLPMGCLENEECGTALVWQINHNGSWQWEIGDIQPERLYLRASGPTEQEHHWWKRLESGMSFASVPVAVGAVCGGAEEAFAALTHYRRRIRRDNEDNKKLPVIFNDYMHCLLADPTAEKIPPVVDAAAEAGCEYYVMDAGWYTEGGWWDTVGEWEPSKTRFPDGIEKTFDYVRSKGLIPGLWIELEVVGIRSPLASRMPDSWFFVRHGKRAIDHGRYQLDFRNPEVVKHADAIIDRFVKDYGVGYIKVDYNINAGLGTELDADSFGDGLLEHNRAYLKWLERVFARYPDLVIENCSSGGLRINYALLRLHSIQSSSDQMDYQRNAYIAASAPTAIAPEQCGVWSYPSVESDREAVIYNMVNSMLLRIHQSGQLHEMAPEMKELVREGIACYKTFREDIAESIPFWPLGFPKFGDGWTSLGLCAERRVYLAVWRLDSGEETCVLPVARCRDRRPAVGCAYPSAGDCAFRWNSVAGTLSVTLGRRYSARLFRFELDSEAG